MYDLRLRPTHAVCALLLGALSVLSGCAGAFGSSTAGMSAAQLKEWVKDKDAHCSRITGVYMGATFSAVSTSADKAMPVGAGSVKVSGEDCSLTITREATTPKP